MNDVVFISAARTPIGRASKGTLRFTRPDDLAAFAIKAALERASGLDPAAVQDVILGCAMPEGEQGMNVARIAAFRAGVPNTVPAFTLNRFCASGLEAIATAAAKIASGQADVIVAGGVESMSMVPFDKSPVKPNPVLMRDNPDAYLAMGLTAENLVNGWHIPREDADAFSLRSHQKALAAIGAGKFKEEIVPVEARFVEMDATGNITEKHVILDTDECPRKETTLEALAKLKPAFLAKNGTVTAGNSSQRSDGAAAVVMMSAKRAQELGLKPIGRFIDFTVTGVPPEIMGIGPATAIPQLLKKTGLTLDDIAHIELNEAFAAQALAVMREYPLPIEKVNPLGGAVALGHPLGCTGARQAVTILHELKRNGGGKGMITMCVGGGMGAAGLIEV